MAICEAGPVKIDNYIGTIPLKLVKQPSMVIVKQNGKSAKLLESGLHRIVRSRVLFIILRVALRRVGQPRIAGDHTDAVKEFWHTLISPVPY